MRESESSVCLFACVCLRASVVRRVRRELPHCSSLNSRVQASKNTRVLK